MSFYCGAAGSLQLLARFSIKLELRSNFRGARCDFSIHKESKRAAGVVRRCRGIVLDLAICGVLVCGKLFIIYIYRVQGLD